MGDEASSGRDAGHAGWVRLTHWTIAAAVLTLAFSGFVILKAHPRLYWGIAGNDLTPALVELPVSRNYHHGGWAPPIRFSDAPGGPVSAARTYDIYNENGWARSLHFLVAWCVVLPGALYLFVGFIGGHLRRNVVPRVRDFRDGALGADLARHLRLPMPQSTGGPPYGVLQKIAYAAVVLVVLPLMVVTGLGMSPAVNSAWPVLQDLFGGLQSARTLHFAGFALLVLFVLVHLAMVVLTGARQQMRAMVLGGVR